MPDAPNRRERRRAETLAAIKEAAMEQLGDGGAQHVSLNAIGKRLGMTGPAIYRYFGSRDELLASIAVDSYGDLADAIEAAARRPHRSGGARWHAVATQYRAWALRQPHRYRLVFSTVAGSGELAPQPIIAAASRSMAVLLDSIARATPADPPPVNRTLAGQLRDWQRRTDLPDLDDAILLAGLNAWTRLHGVISLELDGHLQSTGVDPQLIYQAEVSAIIRPWTDDGPAG